MEMFNKVTMYLINLSEKDFQKQIIAVLAVATLLATGLTYYVYSAGNSRVSEIKQLHKLAEKSTVLLIKNDEIVKEENRIQELLETNRDFNIKSYFEQFCREHKITPEANWDTAVNPIEGNEKFEEVILSASFSGETTKTLVSILDAFDKNEIVYLSELSIRKQNGKISFDLVIATKKLRRLLEE